MTDMIQMFSINLAAVVLLEIAGWLVSIRRNNVTIADSLWGIGFIIIAWLSFMQGDGFFWRKVLIVAAVSA